MQHRLWLPTLTPWKVFIRASLICSLIGAALFGLGLRKIEPLPLSGAPLRFSADQAYKYMRELATRFPNRVTWGENRHKATAWLKSEFQKMGYIPHGMLFSEVVDGRHYTDLENVYAEKQGTERPDEIIVVMAHYDVTDTTVEGAMDDASGVGVVLELARLLANVPTRRSVIFLLTDSEEFGAFWGARAFAQTFERADRIAAAASFDFLAPHDQAKILTLSDGLWRGYTPLWLRQLAVDSVDSASGIEAADMTNVVEFVLRGLQIPAADHGAFLQAGIPAFNWVGQMRNFPYQMGHYLHTPADRAEEFTRQPFETLGRAAERWLKSVDELPRIPENFRSSSYWKISSTYYLDGWTVTLLQILAFIPFLAYSIAKSGITLRNTPRATVLGVLKHELRHVAVLLGALLLGYAVMLLLPALRIITQYEAFPATQKAVLLYTPNFLAILLVVGSVLTVIWIFRRVFGEPPESPRSAEIRHSLYAALLALMILLGFLRNSYLATLLLLPPAYFWTAMRARPRRNVRVLNFLLLVGGAISVITIAVIMSTIFHVGAVYWYLFLAATYGLISAYSVVIFALALTVMIRLCRTFVIGYSGRRSRVSV